MRSLGPANRRVSTATARWWLIPLVGISLVAGGDRVRAQTFSSGSDGSDGTFFAFGPPGTVVTFNPSQYSGSQVSANIFNFTTIVVSAGVTVRLSSTNINGPVHWLSQGDVTIDGTIDLSGGRGYDTTPDVFSRVPAIPGPGGYSGGVGTGPSQVATPGAGPSGGIAGVPTGCSGSGCPATASGGAGRFSGNSFLIPLIGGSGGGGAARPDTNFGSGGGAGGGALLIASSTQIAVNGAILANGGASGNQCAPGPCCSCYAAGGGGGGGAIRLVANSVTGNGTLNAAGGTSGFTNPGTPGVVRLEGLTVSFAGTVQGTRNVSLPFPLLLPTAGPAWAKVISIGGVLITPNPFTFPDITINTASSVPVVIQTKNVPMTATVRLTIFNQNGVPDTVRMLGIVLRT